MDLTSEFYKEITDIYQKCKNLRTLVKTLGDPTNSTNQQLLLSMEREYKDLYDKGHFIFEDDLLYYRKAGGHRLFINPSMKDAILKLCHDEILAGHFSEKKSIKRLQNTSWWLGYRGDMSKHVETCTLVKKLTGRLVKGLVFSKR